jgi:hypothetical protein
MVERSLSMREVRGSIPCTSNIIFLFNFYFYIDPKTQQPSNVLSTLVYDISFYFFLALRFILISFIFQTNEPSYKAV